MRICGNCGAPLEPDAQFCTECGTKVEIQEGRKCPSCGAPLDDDSLFCSECGCKIEDANPSQPVEEPIVKEADVEKHEEHDAVIEDAITKSNEDDILPVPKKGHKAQWLFIGGGIAAIVAVIGWFLWSHFSNRPEFTEIQKVVKVTSTMTSIHTQPDSSSPNVLDRNGDILLLKEGDWLLVIGDAGEWYRIVRTDIDSELAGSEYNEAYINKSVCEDTELEPIPEESATYLRLTDNIAFFISHKSEGRKLVFEHSATSNSDEEYLYLGTYCKGIYIFNYRKKITDKTLSQYRRHIEMSSGYVSLIDLDMVPEKELIGLFEEEIKNHKRICSMTTLPVLERLFLPLSLQQAENVPSPYNGHYEFNGVIAGKYKYFMWLNVGGGNVLGQYIVNDNNTGYVTLSGTMEKNGDFEMSEYKKDTGEPTGYYFTGSLTSTGITGKYLSRNRSIKMSFKGKKGEFSD